MAEKAVVEGELGYLAWLGLGLGLGLGLRLGLELALELALGLGLGLELGGLAFEEACGAASEFRLRTDQEGARVGLIFG